ncbi:MAG: radical SAM protein [Bacilli bacterium]|nr:radical SAM protein [Bacilli bacterium]
MICPLCFHKCSLEEGKTGFCKGRKNVGGKIIPINYGLITALALDPVEKKPFREFYPGRKILSVGSFGCNLACPFCQNFEISQEIPSNAKRFSPSELVSLAVSLKKEGNIGIAFTYNEPMIDPEMIRDTFLLAKKEGLKTAVVTNGCFTPYALSLVLPYTDGMSIDLKGFTPSFFQEIHGDLKTTKEFIRLAASSCHVELVTLVVTRHNDDPVVFEKEVLWIASISPSIPLHITRYFPRYKEKEESTSLSTLLSFEEIAKKYLSHVYLGNI